MGKFLHILEGEAREEASEEEHTPKGADIPVASEAGAPHLDKSELPPPTVRHTSIHDFGSCATWDEGSMQKTRREAIISSGQADVCGMDTVLS